MKRIAILGATGSVGASTLDLIESAPKDYAVAAVTAANRVEELAAIARRTKADLAVIADEDRIGELREALGGSGCRVAAGPEGLAEAAAMGDLTVAAIVGCAGLEPVMAAIAAGRPVALANKEALVTAGALMIEAAGASGSVLIPIDSEHNAIFQCVEGNDSRDIERIILTASGGPFRTASAEQMARATPAEAVAHPNWSMGAKISVDSATMMNKGLELIEARYLFGLPPEKIDIVIHPQSVIHSLVEFRDGSMLAQLGAPDMRIPISFALAYPRRMATAAQRLDLAAIARLDFEEPDCARFPALRLAREALATGAAAPIVLNAANEIAVAAFLDGALGFAAIANLVEEALSGVECGAPRSIGDVLEIDRVTRQRVGSMMERLCR
ncbi:MAG: 1-deoxy-D-xylulose-5-phosphate reductoisomerase [Sphingomicrobium sp.]